MCTTIGMLIIRPYADRSVIYSNIIMLNLHPVHTCLPVANACESKDRPGLDLPEARPLIFTRLKTFSFSSLLQLQLDLP